MSRQLFISEIFRFSGFLIVLFFLSTNGFAAGQATKAKGPIIITSDKLTADNNAHTAVFENSVTARTSDVTMYSDRMVVYYDKDTGNVKRIDAAGRVKLMKESRVITSQEASYYADEEKVVFTGEPRAVEGEDVVTGKKMTYLMNEDRFLVEGSKVFLTKKRE